MSSRKGRIQKCRKKVIEIKMMSFLTFKVQKSSDIAMNE